MSEDREKNSGKPVGGQEDAQKSRPVSPLSGAPVPGGRPKGVPNKITRTFKAAAEEAFEKGGGVDWLVKLMNGTASDRAAVLNLYGRLIPHQLVGQVDHKVKVELSWLGGRNIGKTVLDMESSASQPKALTNQDVTDVDGRQVPSTRLEQDERLRVERGEE